jgi:ribosomal protein L29
MRTQDVKALKQKKLVELKGMVNELESKVFEVAEAMRKGSVKDVHAVDKLHKDIARVKTELNERLILGVEDR